MGLFKKKSNASATGTSPVANTGSALAGVSFRGAKGGKAGAASTTARPTWNTSLNAEPKTGAASIDPPRNGLIFLDCRVAMAPNNELGYLLHAAGKQKLRPVLVPAVLKIVGDVLKAKGGKGVLGDRAIVETHLKSALESARAPEDIIADLNPALDLYWLNEEKYALPDKVEEAMWLGLVNGVDDRPEEAGAALRQGKQGAEVLKQTSERLTISGQIVNVCRNTKGPHLLFTCDGVLMDAAVKDAGGPELTATAFDSAKVKGIGLKSVADADALISKLLKEAAAAQNG